MHGMYSSQVIAVLLINWLSGDATVHVGMQGIPADARLYHSAQKRQNQGITALYYNIIIYIYHC